MSALLGETSDLAQRSLGSSQQASTTPPALGGTQVLQRVVHLAAPGQRTLRPGQLAGVGRVSRPDAFGVLGVAVADHPRVGTAVHLAVDPVTLGRAVRVGVALHGGHRGVVVADDDAGVLQVAGSAVEDLGTDGRVLRPASRLLPGVGHEVARGRDRGQQVEKAGLVEAPAHERGAPRLVVRPGEPGHLGGVLLVVVPVPIGSALVVADLPACSGEDLEGRDHLASSATGSGKEVRLCRTQATAAPAAIPRSVVHGIVTTLTAPAPNRATRDWPKVLRAFTPVTMLQ